MSKVSLNVGSLNDACPTSDSLCFSAMNVIRMIKLFGWEPRVEQQLAEKREDELYYQWRYRLMGVINACLKCVHSLG